MSNLIKNVELKSWALVHGDTKYISKDVWEFENDIGVKIFGDEGEILEALSMQEEREKKATTKDREWEGRNR